MALNEREAAAGPDPGREPALDRAYAAGAHVEPPARLDAAILAAARREVGAGPRRMGFTVRAWRMPLALAAVLVLSVSVVLLMREEGADRFVATPPPAAAPALPRDSAIPAPEGPVAKLEAPPVGAPSGQASSPSRDTLLQREKRPEGDRSLREPAQPEARQQAPQPAPRPFAEPPAAPAEPRRAEPEVPAPKTDTLAKETESGAAAGARAMDRAGPAERQAQALRAPMSPSAAAAPDASVGAVAPPQPTMAKAKPAPENAYRLEQKQRNDVAAGPPPVWQGYEGQPPEKWLERVEELHRAGRDTEARNMLAEFRKRFPQYPVPAALDR